MYIYIYIYTLLAPCSVMRKLISHASHAPLRLNHALLVFTAAKPAPSPAQPPYMLNTRSEEETTVFYSYLACLVKTSTLNVYGFLSYTGITRRNTLFILVWLCHRNT